MDSRVRPEGSKVDLLTLRSLRIVLLRLQMRGEVADQGDVVIMQEILGQRLKIKPLVRPTCERASVHIEAIDVDAGGGPLHRHTLSTVTDTDRVFETPGAASLP